MADSVSRIFLLCIAACVVPLAPASGLKPFTLEVRLTTHLASYSPAGSAFRCVVIRHLESNGKIIIPRGSVISGSVKQAKAVGLGIVRERAMMELSFADYRTPDGQTFPLHAKLASIDNSRERVRVARPCRPCSFRTASWRRTIQIVSSLEFGYAPP